MRWAGKKLFKGNTDKETLQNIYEYLVTLQKDLGLIMDKRLDTTHNVIISADTIGSNEINWGIGAGQVSAGNIPVADIGDYFGDKDVESALQEIGDILSEMNIKLLLEEQLITPDAPETGFHLIYFKTDGKLYSLDSNGFETDIGKMTKADIESLLTGLITSHYHPGGGEPITNGDVDFPELLFYDGDIVTDSTGGGGGGNGEASGIAYYIHHQGVPLKKWTVHHGLNRYPSVTIKDSAGTKWESNVQYATLNTLYITHAGAFAGEAYLI